MVICMQHVVMLNDITTRADIEKLMRSFYARVLLDIELASKFADMNLEMHLPKIIDFWQSTIIGGAEYTGQPFPPHAVLDLEARHFELWLSYFHECLHELFAGPHVEEMKKKAEHVATMFRFQLGLFDS